MMRTLRVFKGKNKLVIGIEPIDCCFICHSLSPLPLPFVAASGNAAAGVGSGIDGSSADAVDTTGEKAKPVRGQSWRTPPRCHRSSRFDVSPHSARLVSFHRFSPCHSVDETI
ncbi:hypothetical protein Nepgr_009440 [Nepenthes gracilis]|uniref:Uncharacterized protein n=1 Tax=Nepenthes gracilis TaxID=150966 RepID=A0AAD3SB14_NEPGR|nr:hypothetical protein Nepgr_009440 [Nepenthes gracilis]